MLSSSRLSRWVHSRESACFSGTLSVILPDVRLGRERQERLDPRNVKVVHTIYSGYRNSLGDGDRCGGDIPDLALEWVAQFPPLYAAGDFDINFPFQVELLTQFDHNKLPRL